MLSPFRPSPFSSGLYTDDAPSNAWRFAYDRAEKNVDEFVLLIA